MNNGNTVEDNLVSLIAKIGEKITIGRTKTLNNPNSQNFTYQHSVIKDNVSKLGVIVSLETKDKNDEIKIFGKSADILKKIGLGKINKFKEENSLMTQYWVIDPKKKVKDIISEINVPNLKINEFVRIKIGE